MIARRLGRSVVLLDRDRHPRFAIGESSTPLANLLLEELATRYDLPRLLPLTKWGTWQSSHPEIACGLKRGFSFYHHTFDRPFSGRRDDQLLVAASPHDAIADTHWYRADFDHFLVNEAQRLGAVLYDQVALDRLTPAWKLEGTRNGRRLTIRARFVVDATGPCGFLHRALGLPEAPFPNLPATEGLYAHFQGVRRLDSFLPADGTPPYPVDAAALHHVFDGGWIWVLRFNNGITSAGAAITASLARELNLAEGAPAWQRLLARLPTVAEQFAEAEAVTPFVHRRPLAFRSARFTGERWAMLPSAAGFIDPLLSTGFPLTLLGVARLAEALEQGFEERLPVYEAETAEALQAAERLVAALYANLADFPRFAALSLLYFAAASYTETARRLGRPRLAGAFLLSDHPWFGPRSRTCCERALKSRDPELIEEIHRVIEPIDVAGLGDRCRRNWFPVEAEDLLAAAGKLEAAPEEIEALLRRSGFRQA
ncbi:MAG: tetracycline 7-halogenase / O2-dependent halogenase [Acidobacteriota bacterium]|nr:tetracycline 7-halogenase / O2-dependent halogenase [Acidobacteriota bacterium]